MRTGSEGGVREPGPHGVAGARCRRIWTIMRAGGIQPAWPAAGQPEDGRTQGKRRATPARKTRPVIPPRDAGAMCWHNTSTVLPSTITPRVHGHSRHD